MPTPQHRILPLPRPFPVEQPFLLTVDANPKERTASVKLVPLVALKDAVVGARYTVLDDCSERSLGEVKIAELKDELEVMNGRFLKAPKGLGGDVYFVEVYVHTPKAAYRVTTTVDFTVRWITLPKPVVTSSSISVQGSFAEQPTVYLPNAGIVPAGQVSWSGTSLTVFASDAWKAENVTMCLRAICETVPIDVGRASAH